MSQHCLDTIHRRIPRLPKVLGRFLLAGMLVTPFAGSVVIAPAAIAAEAVPEQPVDPFTEAANANVPMMSVPDPSTSTMAQILEELDPDLEQIQAQIDAGEYDIPKAWLSQKIRSIEHESHRFDRALVRPITMLGDIQVLEGDYVGALESFGRAIHTERVSAGLVSAGQIEIVYREAETYRSLGNFEAANQREEYAYHVLQRAHDPYSEEMLPGLYHLAGWYEKTGNVFASRHLYQRAADVLIANGKGQTMEAIPAWEGVARTFRLERFPPVYIDPSDAASYGSGGTMPAGYGPVTINNFPAGERALQQIIQIHRDHGSETAVLAQSLLDLADWHLLFEKTREAYPLYQIAYELMEGVEGFPIEDFFGTPKVIHFPAPPDPDLPDDETTGSPIEGLVSVQLDVSDRGAARNLQTVDSRPPGMMDFRVRKSLRIARFRPAILNGQPAMTEDYVYTHRFTYYPEPTIVETTEGSDE
jgi:hypothetical protein